MPHPGTTAPLDSGALDELNDTDLCEDCEEVLSDFFCNVCQCSLCADCWDRQPAHRRKKLAPGQIPHEKTELLLANRIDTVFNFSKDERAFERLHKDDEVTAWFGLEREMREGRPFMFRDHGRFADLATWSHRSLFKRRASTAGLNQETNCIPSLVSFVGQTGAGKSTLIKLLIQFNQYSKQEHDYPSPVPGIAGRDLPTSEDVHLYADPLTVGSEYPILYADSEGLDGGEREPLAATFRKTRVKRESESSGSVSGYMPTRNYTEREVQWMTSKMKRTRQYAAGQLYPRVLFAFSDVVVFVHRNPRAIEGVLERLLEWGSVAIETTYNQPILPYAIIALNATENDLESRLWDVQTSSRSLLDSLANTVDKNVEFSKYAALWRSRGKIINNVEDLMLCYYSSLRVVRLPTNGRPKLIESQAQALYLDIERGCRLARNLRIQTRMLLSAFEFQAYLSHAFDHFCTTIERPFDFVECSYLNSRLSSTFGESILALASAMAKKKPRPQALDIFEKLARLIASCILLDSVRNGIKGTSERVFAQYIPQIDSALKEFGDRHWPCEFYVKGTVPAHLQAHLNNMQFQQSMRAAAVIMRCANVRSGHAAKGHQLSDGRVFARGAYESSFSFETDRKQVLDNIYFWYHSFTEKLSSLTLQGRYRLDIASDVHLEVLANHYSRTEKHEPIGLRHTAFCICCLFGTSEALLPCGHMLCRNCIQAYGRRKGHALVDVQECPLEYSHGTESWPRLLYLRPANAGARVLALNNGGVRSIIQIELLKLIEKELNGKISIQSFFDMIIGEGTGGVLALGLVSRGWTLNDCERYLSDLFADIFAPANAQRFPNVSLMPKKASHAKYRPKVLDDSLCSLFPTEQRIVDLSATDDPVHQSTKVAVLISSATGRKVLVSNYRRNAQSRLSYTLYPAATYTSQLRVCELARASMAHTDLFKPFPDPRLGNLFFKRDMSEGFLIEVAHNECQATYSGLQRDFPDVLLSLGCGKSKRGPTPSIASNETKQTKDTRRTKSTWRPSRDDSHSMTTHSEDSSETYAQYPRPNFISLNPVLDDVPNLDDVSSMADLQRLIWEDTDASVITKLVAQLFATLFYAEADDPIKDNSPVEKLIPVRVYCRLLDHTSEMEEVGKLLKSGNYRNSEFVFWEDGHDPQQFPLTARQLDAIIHAKEFKAHNVLVPLWQPHGLVHGVLRLENGEEYPLSGFPRRFTSAVRGIKPTQRTNLEVPQPAKTPSPAWSAPSIDYMQAASSRSSYLSFQSLRLDDDHLSGSPGPTEVSNEVPEYGEDITALPAYTR